MYIRKPVAIARLAYRGQVLRVIRATKRTRPYVIHLVGHAMADVTLITIAPKNVRPELCEPWARWVRHDLGPPYSEHNKNADDDDQDE